ncbi:MAG: HAMP domain-containing protein [bacterium]
MRIRFSFRAISIILLVISFLLAAIFREKIAVAAGFLAGGGLLFFIVEMCVIKPVRKLQSALKKIREENFSFRLPHRPFNEIGDLFAIFNEAAQALKDSRVSIEKDKAALEKSAWSKTEELKNLTEKFEKKVKEANKEVYEKMEELERFNKLAVGRELKMIELKAKLKKLARYAKAKG